MRDVGIFDLVQARIERAEEHLGSLDLEVTGYSDSRPYRPVIKDEAELRRMVAEFRVQPPPWPKAFDVVATEVSPPPVSIALIVGDIVHSLRSSLDNLAVLLVENYSTGAPVFETNRNSGLNGMSGQEPLTAFPFKRKQPASNAPVKELLWPRTTAQIEAVLDRLQPYNRGTRLGETSALLQELSNTDKHRALRLGVAIVSGPGHIWIRYPDKSTAGATWSTLHSLTIHGSADGTSWESRSEIPLEDGADLGFLPVSDAVAHLNPIDGEMEVHADVALKVTLDEAGTAQQGAAPVLDTCRALIDFVRDDVLGALRQVV